MSYRAIMSARAIRDLDAMPARVAPAIAEFIYGGLSENPHRCSKALMRELEGQFTARRGAYRVLLEIDDETQTIKILHIDHRADAYR